MITQGISSLVAQCIGQLSDTRVITYLLNVEGHF